MTDSTDNLWARLELSAEIDTEHLQKQRVLLVGAGGLGNDLALRLGGCNIAHLTLIDGDTVSTANVPHSTLFVPQHAGLPKVHVLERFLTTKFPQLSVTALPLFVQQCDPAQFANHDLIICAPDNDQTRRWVNYYAVQHQIPALFLGVSGKKSAEWTGYTYFYQPGVNACFACFAAGGETGGESFDTVDDDSDIEAARNKCGGDNVPMPMLAPVVGMLASYAAAQALRVLGAVDTPPTYAYVDLKASRIVTHDVLPVDDCVVCQQSAEFDFDPAILDDLGAQS